MCHIEIVVYNYCILSHRICHVDIVYCHMESVAWISPAIRRHIEFVMWILSIVTSLLSIVTLLLSIVASMLSHVHHRIARPLGPP